MMYFKPNYAVYPPNAAAYLNRAAA